VGPYGSAHQHRDKLHIALDAFGRALLVDTGRYNYRNRVWQPYFVGTRGHNTLRIDGADQNAWEKLADEPTPADDYGFHDGWDFARGTFTAGYEGVAGDARHTRVLVYLHHRFWVVVDHVRTDRPRRIEALWHFAPECSVRLDGAEAVTVDPGVGNLRVVPAGAVGWEADIVAGVETPEIQGWYSGYYDVRVPTPTAIYRGSIPESAAFAWVLYPAAGEVPPVRAAILSGDDDRVEIRVEVDPEAPFLITVPIHRGTPQVRRGD
jgi:hypothetical protein